MNNRHHKIIALLLGAGLLGVTGLANAGIVNSKHDLSNLSTAANRVTGTGTSATTTDETCVFCHTPHAAASNTVPLWNKQLTAAPATVYSSTTMDGTAVFAGSTSMACLSCHDGSQAMDNIVNAPGSGGLTANGGDLTGLAYTWTATVNADGTLMAGVTNLSTNLGDDHPVAIPYGGGGADPSAATTDPDFNLLTKATIGGITKWWVDTALNPGSMDATEIRTYTVGGVAQVECASCHDPHNSTNATFLRVANAKSAVCTACHVK